MIFAVGRWADAFIKACEGPACEGPVCEGRLGPGAGVSGDAPRQCEAGLAVIKSAFYSLSHLRNVVSGSTAAARFNGFLRAALQKCGYTDKETGIEAALAVIFLLIQRGRFQYTGLLISEIEEMLLKKRNILTVLLDCAEKPDDGFLEALKTTLKEREGARDVRITTVLMPELLGGCRINIDGKREDFSVLGRMKQMERSLTGA
ncbi:MAG: F0F1 ATP synthase subunit delta [Spirochaetaceae bacterium]|nr:F0F1 ATP synthase subunit delta [Spirochaetaceae bacterium]